MFCAEQDVDVVRAVRNQMNALRAKNKLLCITDAAASTLERCPSLLVTLCAMVRLRPTATIDALNIGQSVALVFVD